MHPIKVAHVTAIALSLRYLLLNQMRSLQDAGYEVVGLSAFDPEAPALEAAGVRHLPVPFTRRVTPLQDLRAFWRLYRLFRREGFTIVHTHTPKPGLLGQLAARMAGVPVVVNTLHGFYFHDGMPSAGRRFYIALEKIAARCSDVILSQNREDIETAIREGVCPPEKIRHLGNGINLALFDPGRLRPGDVRHKREAIGLPRDAKVVGFVGRLVQEKGLPELFAAARSVRERMPDARFLLVGPLDTEKPDAVTPEAAQDYGVADVCHFLGLRRDMPELYALMDLLVLPSHREGFPRTPMEAAAMGVPVVATDIRGCREAVAHGRNGLLVPLGDVEALAGAILDLLADGARARRMGEAGRRLARERFDERQVFERVKAEYARLLREKGLPVPEPCPFTNLSLWME